MAASQVNSLKHRTVADNQIRLFRDPALQLDGRDRYSNVRAAIFPARRKQFKRLRRRRPTIPGKGWFVSFRIYGPEKSAFNGTWKFGIGKVSAFSS